MEEKDNKPVYSANREEDKNKTNIDEVVNEVTNKNKVDVAETSVKKKFIDVNMSWIQLIVIAGLTFGIGYAHQKSLSSTSFNQYLYVFLFVFLSYFISLIVYNAGKVLFGYFGNYQVATLDFVGLKIIMGDKKLNRNAKFVYSFKNFFELHLSMKPKNEKANPTFLFIGGVILYALFALILGLIAISLTGNISISLLYGIAMGTLIPLYELTPVKLDCPNDMYLLLTTLKKEDKVAYNNVLTNKYYDLIQKEPVIKTYDTYEKSRIKPLTLVYKLRSQIYAKQYKEALQTLDIIDFYSVYFTDSDICESMSERLYIYLTQGRTAEADKLVVKFTRILKNTSNYTKSLAAARTEILISGLLDNSLEETKLSIASFKKNIERYEDYKENSFILKDLEFANDGISRINKVHPSWKLDYISIK